MTSLLRRVLRRPDPVTVTFYGRSPCGLCDKAMALLLAEVPHAEVDYRDIDDDDDLLARFHIRVPVVEVAGRVVAEGAIAPGQFRAALRRPTIGAVADRVRSRPWRLS